MVAANHEGKVIQVIGSTFDVEFGEGHLPPIYNALVVDTTTKDGNAFRLVGEIQQHLGSNRCRCVALGSTDGLARGVAAKDTGGPVSVPVGMNTLGRVFNLLGEPIDNRGPVKADEHRSIHRAAPELDTLSSATEIFETVSRSLTDDSVRAWW